MNRTNTSLLFQGVPLRVGLSTVSFLLYKTKKDAAAIPNAASRLPYSKKVKQLLSVVFCSLIFNAFTKPTLKKPKELFFTNALNEIKKEETEIWVLNK